MERINSRPRKFAKKVKEFMEKMHPSPISQAITFELLKRGSETEDPKVAIYNEFKA